jgi:hypothetical protein
MQWQNRLKKMEFKAQISPEKINRAMDFDINALWQLAFGYKGLPFPTHLLNSSVPGLGASIPLVNRFNKKDLRSITGTKLYETTSNGRLTFMPVWLNEKLLPITRVGLSRRKLLVETAMTGYEGTVKEGIRSDDFNITIQGIAFGEGRMYPDEEMSMIEELCKINAAIPIKNALTDIFLKDMSAVITDYNIIPARSEHVQAYEIKLLSDEIFDLYID